MKLMVLSAIMFNSIQNSTKVELTEPKIQYHIKIHTTYSSRIIHKVVYHGTFGYLATLIWYQLTLHLFQYLFFKICW